MEGLAMATKARGLGLLGIYLGVLRHARKDWTTSPSLMNFVTAPDESLHAPDAGSRTADRTPSKSRKNQRRSRTSNQHSCGRIVRVTTAAQCSNGLFSSST